MSQNFLERCNEKMQSIYDYCGTKAKQLYADLCKRFDDKQVLDAMHSFFFADEDWPGNNKIWYYMSCKHDK